MLISLDRCQALISRSELQYLLLDPAQLSSRMPGDTHGPFPDPPVAWIGDNIEQFLDTVTPDRRNDPDSAR